MTKVLQLIQKFAEERPIKVVIFIVLGLYAVFDLTDGLRSMLAVISGKEKVDEIFITILVLVLVGWVLHKIYLRKKFQEEGQHAFEKARYNEQVYSIAHEIVTTFKGSKAFHDIVDTHIKNVNFYFNTLRGSLRQRIESSITKETLNEFDRVRNSVAGQKNLMASIFRNLSDVPEMEAFLRKEHRACLIELRDHILKTIRSNKLFSHFDRYSDHPGEWGHMTDFDFEAADILAEIEVVLAAMPELTLVSLFTNEQGANDLSAAGMVAAGLTSDDIADILGDIVDGETAEQIFHELTEYAGTFIPLVGKVFIVVKIFRFLYSLRDRTEDLNKLQTEIYNSAYSNYTKIEQAACKKIRTDSVAYLDKLIEKFRAGFEKAQRFRRRNEWYM